MGDTKDAMGGTRVASTPSQNPFEQAYIDYVKAIKAAWAQVDVDAAVDGMLDENGNVTQGCGEGLSTWGTAGTFGTVGSAGGTLASIGTLGTAGSLGVTEEGDSGTDEAGYDEGAQS